MSSLMSCWTSAFLPGGWAEKPGNSAEKPGGSAENFWDHFSNFWNVTNWKRKHEDCWRLCLFHRLWALCSLIPSWVDLTVAQPFWGGLNCFGAQRCPLSQTRKWSKCKQSLNDWKFLVVQFQHDCFLVQRLPPPKKKLLYRLPVNPNLHIASGFCQRACRCRTPGGGSRRTGETCSRNSDGFSNGGIPRPLPGFQTLSAFGGYSFWFYVLHAAPIFFHAGMEILPNIGSNPTWC